MAVCANPAVDCTSPIAMCCAACPFAPIAALGADDEIETVCRTQFEPVVAAGDDATDKFVVVADGAVFAVKIPLPMVVIARGNAARDKASFCRPCCCCSYHPDSSCLLNNN